jgi:hypothetical protein
MKFEIFAAIVMASASVAAAPLPGADADAALALRDTDIPSTINTVLGYKRDTDIPSTVNTVLGYKRDTITAKSVLGYCKKKKRAAEEIAAAEAKA